MYFILASVLLSNRKDLLFILNSEKTALTENKSELEQLMKRI